MLHTAKNRYLEDKKRKNKLKKQGLWEEVKRREQLDKQGAEEEKLLAARGAGGGGAGGGGQGGGIARGRADDEEGASFPDLERIRCAEMF